MRRRHILFSELARAARAAGTYLARRYGCVSRPVAVAAERSSDSIAAFMGVLASGNYYVPVDTSMPRRRMERILEKIRPVCFLAPETQKEKLVHIEEFCPLEEMERGFASEEDTELLASARESVLDVDPAYVIFTSGSTGVPKGHRHFPPFGDRFYRVDERDILFDETEVFGNQAPFYFDLSVKDIYRTLRNGATCYIFPKKFFLFPKLLLQFAQEKRSQRLSGRLPLFIWWRIPGLSAG